MYEIPIVENVLKANDEIAATNRARIHAAGIHAINLIGSPGCGKTTLLERTLERLRDEATVGVIAGDLATARDALRLRRWTEHVVQVNTGRGCHLEAHQVRQAFDRLDLATIDLLIIENVGNLICPVGFDLGHDAKVGMFSVSEGDDKAAKHPHLVMTSDVILLNKTDLLGVVPFERRVFLDDLARLRPDVPLIELSAATGRLEPWLAWLRRLIRRAAPAAPAPV